MNFRLVDYRDLSINFAMLLNPQFANKIPHEYLSTVKFNNIDKFDGNTYLYRLDMSHASAGIYMIKMGNSTIGYKTGRIIVK